MGALGLALASGVQGVSQISGGIAQSQAIKAQGEYQEKMLNLNAQMAEAQGKDALRRGEKDVQAHQRKTAQLIGAQRVAAAAQGLQVGEGSAAEIQADTAALSAEDVVTIRSNAWREAWGYRSQAVDYRGKAEMARISSNFMARNTLLTGITGGATSLATAGYYGHKHFQDKKKKSASEPLDT